MELSSVLIRQWNWLILDAPHEDLISRGAFILTPAYYSGDKFDRMVVRSAHVGFRPHFHPLDHGVRFTPRKADQKYDTKCICARWHLFGFEWTYSGFAVPCGGRTNSHPFD